MYRADVFPEEHAGAVMSWAGGIAGANRAQRKGPTSSAPLGKGRQNSGTLFLHAFDC